jgi:hypothetical protein
MSIRKRFTGPGSQPAGFTCPTYQPVGDGKRCQHYVDGGGCNLPDHDRCTEWLKANAPVLTPEPPTAAPVTPPTAPGFQLMPEPPPPTAAPVTPATPDTPKPTYPDYRTIPVVRNVTDEEIDAFKKLGVEVCLATEHCGDVWIVPTSTGKDRNELTIEQACTLAALCGAFPGSKVTSFKLASEADADFPAR